MNWWTTIYVTLVSIALGSPAFAQGGCGLSLSAPSTSISAAGASGTITVATSCFFAPVLTGDYSWYTGHQLAATYPVATPGSISYSFSPNRSQFSKSIVITAATGSSYAGIQNGERFAEASITFTQAGGCQLDLMPASFSLSAAGGPVTGTITTAAGCPWTTLSNDSWLSLSPPAGTGGGTLEIIASPNTSAIERSGTFRIGGVTHTVTQAGTTSTSVGLSNGLYAYYSEEGGLHTDSIGSHPGIQIGLATQTSGKIGGANEYNGNGSESDPHAKATLPVSGWNAATVSAWVKPSVYTSGNLETIWQLPELNAWGHIWLAIDSVNRKLYLHLGNGQGSATEISGLNALSDSSWYHIVATWDKGLKTATLYVNGIQQGTAQVPSWGQQLDEFHWGAGFNGFGMRGAIDEIGVWNRVLTGVEVMNLYNNGAGRGIPFDAASSTSGLVFIPVSPCRVVETRAQYNFEGRTGAFGPPALASGETRTVNLPQSGLCNIPAEAKAYVVNVTLIPTTVVDFVTIWPAGEGRPEVWTVRSPDGQIVANSAIVKAGSNGGISIYSTDRSDMLIDISGYYKEKGASSGFVFYPMSPCRVVDTRAPYRSPAGPFGPPSMTVSQTRKFRIPDTPYCSVPTAAAYSVTLTVVPPGPLAYLTMWPDGKSQPNVSSINSFSGRVLANSLIVPASSDGSINVYTYNATDFLLDVNGYYGADDGQNGLYYYPISQCRASDSTTSAGPYADETARTIRIPSVCSGINTPAKAYAINVTALPNGNSLPFITAYAAGQSRPNASILNAFQGQTITNSAIIPASPAGAIDIYAYRQTNVVVEVSGYFGR